MQAPIGGGQPHAYVTTKIPPLARRFSCHLQIAEVVKKVWMSTCSGFGVPWAIYQTLRSWGGWVTCLGNRFLPPNCPTSTSMWHQGKPTPNTLLWWLNLLSIHLKPECSRMATCQIQTMVIFGSDRHDFYPERLSSQPWRGEFNNEKPSDNLLIPTCKGTSVERLPCSSVCHLKYSTTPRPDFLLLFLLPWSITIKAPCKKASSNHLKSCLLTHVMKFASGNLPAHTISRLWEVGDTNHAEKVALYCLNRQMAIIHVNPF